MNWLERVNPPPILKAGVTEKYQRPEVERVERDSSICLLLGTLWASYVGESSLPLYLVMLSWFAMS